MFKKIKYDSGKREIYFGKKKIFQYINQNKFVEFVEKLSNNLIHTYSSTLDVNKISYDLRNGGAGFYAFDFLLKRANIAFKYHKIFYDLYLRGQNNEKLIFIDGGCHNGVFSDIALACGAVSYAFEPNIYLCAFLNNLYKDNPNFILAQQAISNKNEKTIFYNLADDIVSQGASIVKSNARANLQKQGYEVDMIDFCEVTKELLQRHGKINFIKLDIEGAEFDVLDAFIEQNLCEKIEYIMVETHERLFDNPNEKLNALKAKISKNNISNIYLDWI
ncbi:methyltransferase [Candidatus Campylobacter infans]|uniref:Methyltransferase n=1 Tax=Candidatus Campylobacter infans TaxID=2561898 RepID=A0A7H9CJ78_9BACT|nr:FkbM family methyltransferase [Candidatus Campylobacter infans]QLI04789.1 methyltransferase [Candidatus Campylobacter infans]